MHPADIQSELKKAGVTQAEIAEELGVSPFHVSAVIHGRASDRVMRNISEKIGRNRHEVFPFYYFRRHRRKRK